MTSMMDQISREASYKSPATSVEFDRRPTTIQPSLSQSKVKVLRLTNSMNDISERNSSISCQRLGSVQQTTFKPSPLSNIVFGLPKPIQSSLFGAQAYLNFNPAEYSDARNGPLTATKVIANHQIPSVRSPVAAVAFEHPILHPTFSLDGRFARHISSQDTVPQTALVQTPSVHVWPTQSGTDRRSHILTRLLSPSVATAALVPSGYKRQISRSLAQPNNQTSPLVSHQQEHQQAPEWHESIRRDVGTSSYMYPSTESPLSRSTGFRPYSAAFKMTESTRKGGIYNPSERTSLNSPAKPRGDITGPVDTGVEPSHSFLFRPQSPMFFNARTGSDRDALTRSDSFKNIPHAQTTQFFQVPQESGTIVSQKYLTQLHRQCDNLKSQVGLSPDDEFDLEQWTSKLMVKQTQLETEAKQLETQIASLRSIQTRQKDKLLSMDGVDLRELEQSGSQTQQEEDPVRKQMLEENRKLKTAVSMANMNLRTRVQSKVEHIMGQANRAVEVEKEYLVAQYQANPTVLNKHLRAYIGLMKEAIVGTSVGGNTVNQT